MTFFKKYICIDANNWRYKVAQFVLGVLYGRKWHYISPWKHASVGANAYIIHDSKVLITKRSGGIENEGKYSTPGGHIELDQGEEILDALVREIKEEILIDIPANAFNVHKPTYIDVDHSRYYNEIADAGHIDLRYTIHLDEMPNTQLSNEVSEILWLTHKEVVTLAEKKLYFGVIPPADIFK